VCQEGGLAACFPQAVLMVPSSVFVPITRGEHSPSDGFPLGKTISFGRLEFIADRFNSLSLPPWRWLGCRCHGPRPRWATAPVADHDGKPHRGVPYSSWRGGEDWPPLPRETRRGVSSHFNHNHTAAGELSDRSSNNDHSAAVRDAAVEQQPPP
jgi:hypothetical protein